MFFFVRVPFRFRAPFKAILLLDTGTRIDEVLIFEIQQHSWYKASTGQPIVPALGYLEHPMLGLGPKAAGRKLCPSMLDRSTAYSLVASRTSVMFCLS